MKIAMVDISRATAAHFKLLHSDLMGAGRERKLSNPRMLAMVLCREHTNRSFPQIGCYFRRDHTTVIHAIRDIGPGTWGWIKAKEDVDAIMALALAMASARVEREAAWVAELNAGKISWIKDQCRAAAEKAANDAEPAPHGLNIFRLVHKRRAYAPVLVPIPRAAQMPPSMITPLSERRKMGGRA